MLVLGSIIYLLTTGSQFGTAIPLGSVVHRTDSTNNALAQPAQCDCTPQRSLSEIFWSCLITIFACSWVSVHPNMPSPGDSPFKKTMRRIELMIWAIIAPELIIYWAMRQWFGARKMKKEFRVHHPEWTKTHGYFLQMGGFVLYEDNRPLRVLQYSDLSLLKRYSTLIPLKKANKNRLYLEGKIEFPSISEDEIRDRSKADALGKALAVVQTVWFVAQCIARASVPGLVLTELELVTMAFAVLNGFMYFLWWNKPLNAQTPVAVHLLKVQGPRKDYTELTADTGPPWWEVVLKTLRNAPKTVLNVTIASFQGLRQISLPKFNVLWHGLLSPFIRIIEIMDGVSTNTIGETQTKIPTFYSISPANTNQRNYTTLISCIVAVIFGAVHCAGWSLSFPSHTEKILWRILSIAITSIPMFIVLDVAFALRVKNLANAFWLLTLFSLPLYIVARIMVLILAFMGLRNLPPGAHTIVEWTTFIPHI